MPKETLSEKRLRASVILKVLDKTYPDAKCELHHGSALELLVATILSAQCTDKQVNLVTQSLFKKYRSAADFANATQTELERDIQRIGLFRAKARHIRACCASLLQSHSGQVPASMSALLDLEGVGRKTANVVLGTAFGMSEGIVVDTHVARLSHRLAFSSEKSPEKIEGDLARLFPRHLWVNLSHWLIWHGRRRCSSRRPDCSNCEVEKWCPSSTLRTNLLKPWVTRNATG